MKTKIEIKSWLGKLLFEYECENNTISKTVEEAAKSRADLRGAALSDADLRGAVLSDADLRGAVLRGADLRGAVLSDADLRGAVLSDADLRGAVLRGADLSDAVLSDADLRGADLSDAVLSDADLRGADLRGADLSDAVLSDADLRGADLRGADLSDIRNDFWDVLIRAPHEIAGLRLALQEGRVNGSTYEGECACLVGTIANIQHRPYNEIPQLRPNASRPIERFFLGIGKGDTPENNALSAIVVGWIDEFTALTAKAQ